MLAHQTDYCHTTLNLQDWLSRKVNTKTMIIFREESLMLNSEGIPYRALLRANLIIYRIIDLSVIWLEGCVDDHQGDCDPVVHGFLHDAGRQLCPPLWTGESPCNEGIELQVWIRVNEFNTKHKSQSCTKFSFYSLQWVSKDWEGRLASCPVLHKAYRVYLGKLV